MRGSVTQSVDAGYMIRDASQVRPESFRPRTPILHPASRIICRNFPLADSERICLYPIAFNHFRSSMLTTETTGLAAERLAKIRRILAGRQIVRVDELCRELGVSAATVRRDLVELDRRGWARRVHGGAVSVESRMDEPVFADKAAIAAREKQRIAEAALELIKNSDSIFLDGGSTVLALARLLAEREKLTVVTNSLRVASTLSGGGPRMILVGGELRRLSQTFVGSLTEALIEQLHVDTAFIGTIGFSAEEGMTTTDPREAYTKDLIIQNARQVVLLADSSKAGKVSFVEFGSLDDVDLLITDKGMPVKQSSAFKKKRGMKVIRA